MPQHHLEAPNVNDALTRLFIAVCSTLIIAMTRIDVILLYSMIREHIL